MLLPINKIKLVCFINNYLISRLVSSLAFPVVSSQVPSTVDSRPRHKSDMQACNTS